MIGHRVQLKNCVRRDELDKLNGQRYKLWPCKVLLVKFYKLDEWMKPLSALAKVLVVDSGSNNKRKDRASVVLIFGANTTEQLYT